jgi:hypothetical protein
VVLPERPPAGFRGSHLSYGTDSKVLSNSIYDNARVRESLERGFFRQTSDQIDQGKKRVKSRHR